MKNSLTTSVSFTVAAFLFATACTPVDAVDPSESVAAPSTTAESTSSPTSPTTSASPTTSTSPAAGEEGAGSSGEVAAAELFDLQDVVRRIDAGFVAAKDVWSGFDPNAEPIVLALKDNADGLQGVLAINHPMATELGDAEELDISGTALTSAHLVTNVAAEEARRLQNLQGFDFHMQIKGLDSFAMVAGGNDSFFDPETADYTATLIHEVFHRWQDSGFEGGIGGQDVEGYAYTPENIELAALEDRALIEALKAESEEARTEAARSFASIRLVRLAADPRVRLDNSQERFEGTARYLEHKFAGADEQYSYNETNFDQDLYDDPLDAGRVKDHYGFGRFYGGGAAILQVLAQLGVDDAAERVNAGESPAEVLIDIVGVQSEEAPALVEAAKKNLDPLGQLADSAATAAEQAKGEPPVFGDVPGGSVEGLDDVPEGEGTEITSEEIACLIDRGVDLNSGQEISDEDFEACIEL